MRDRVLGARIRDRRKALNLTRADLGERVGMSDQMIRKYERGASRLSALALFDLAVALKVRLDHFFVEFDEYELLRTASRYSQMPVSEPQIAGGNCQ